MSTIQAVLLDAEEKQVKNRGLTVWLEQLKDVFYDVVDVLDEFECEALRRQVVKTHGSAPGQVLSSFNPLGFSRKMSQKINGIRERLEEIAKHRAQFLLVERLDDKRIVQREMTHSFVRDSDVIGRDDDKEKIIDLLMHPGDDGTVPVISIVGIGGLGKTTLAQWVYNDERVAKNFASRIWVCVSEEFTVLKLAKEILKSVGGEISENMSMDKVQASLRSYLKEKRFFIVLDDVWNEDRNKWIGLKKLLIEGAKGSKIVVTTRSHKVAKVMAPGPIHDLIGLPEDDCLFLFLKWAFVEGEEKQYPKLVEIGKQIVKKCSGVPLAVRTLGSLLYSKTEERDWISIRDNEIWNLEQKEDDILPALRLRNTHIKKLPNSICDLQNLESLILCGYDELEELPRDIRDRRKIFSNKFILYGCDELEELPRDIRKMVSIKYFWITTKQTCLPTNEIMSMCSLRDLFFRNCPGLESFPEGIHRLTALRTLGFMDCESLISLPQGLKHLTALESLAIWRCEKINLMEGEDYLTRLRSFTIGFLPKLVDLPQWLIQSATTLQFLWIYHCENLAALPEWLPNLTSLQKLQIWECRKLSSLPEGMGCLTALRELEIDNCGELSKNCERECHQHLELLLESIPSMFQNNRTAESAFGAAVQGNDCGIMELKGMLYGGWWWMRSMGAFGVVGALLLVEVPMVSVCGKRLGMNGINSLFIALLWLGMGGSKWGVCRSFVVALLDNLGAVVFGVQHVWGELGAAGPCVYGLLGRVILRASTDGHLEDYPSLCDVVSMEGEECL
uniref:NB-ARC domain-containing protein n=1 Tax=Fagus sylvatica TaxID=28930 RepID=A0A2N9GHD5_FAGSY